MKIIKRNVKRAVKTQLKNVDGVEYVNIVPDLDATYTFTFLLTSENKNWGFFDAYDFSGETGTTINTFDYIVTGYSDSRLYFLEKHTVTNNMVDKYFHSTNVNVNGVNFDESTYDEYPMIIHYYIDNIHYVDTYIDDTENGYLNTYYIFYNTYPNDNFINKPYYKAPYSDTLTNQINVDSDIYIDRQKVQVFTENMNLEHIENMYDLRSYVAGNYYNIIKIN